MTEPAFVPTADLVDEIGLKVGRNKSGAKALNFVRPFGLAAKVEVSDWVVEQVLPERFGAALTFHPADGFTKETGLARCRLRLNDKEPALTIVTCEGMGFVENV